MTWDTSHCRLIPGFGPLSRSLIRMRGVRRDAELVDSNVHYNKLVLGLLSLFLVMNVCQYVLAVYCVMVLSS